MNLPDHNIPLFRGRPDAGRIVAFLILLVFSGLLVAPVSGIVLLEYFHAPGCINCENADSVIDTIQARYPDRVTIERIRIDDRAGFRLLLSYGMSEIPAVVINRNRVLTWQEITPDRLDEEIHLAESGSYPLPAKRNSLFDGNNVPSLLFSYILGLMTGFSPCLLGSLILVLSVAGYKDSTGTGGKYLPLTFGAGILVAYLIATGLVLGAGSTFSPDAVSRQVIYGTAGVVAVTAGLIQIGLISLPGRLKNPTTAAVTRFRSLSGTFLLGIIFAVLFAPCAFAPFLILIGAVLFGSSIAPAGMLIMFSLGLFTPYAAIAALRHAIPESTMLRWSVWVQRLGGILLIGFGIWLFLSI
jgi:cytochrome c biogenesis protein CcdA